MRSVKPNAYTCDCDNWRGPPPANTITDVSSQNQSQDGAQLLEEDVDCNHTATLMGKEHIENLDTVSLHFFTRTISYNNLRTYCQLNQSLISRRANTLNCQHDIVLSSPVVESAPYTATQKDDQTQDVDNLAPQLHCRWNPDDVEKSQEEIVQCAATIHIGQANTCIF